MKKMLAFGQIVLGLISVALGLFIPQRAIGQASARPTIAGQKNTSAQNDIGGAVTSSNGPEAGVWVIAETADLPTKLRKIVVTDDRGRFLVPDLPKGNYKVWVRGYGLVDSAPVLSAPGKRLALKATLAPDARAAAQIYPANYWYSLLEVPSASEFPFLKPERGFPATRPPRKRPGERAERRHSQPGRVAFCDANMHAVPPGWRQVHA